MNAEKFVVAIERFFLDIIGTVIPGLALLGGVWAVFGPVQLGTLTLPPPADEPAWVITIVIAYVLGHALTSVGERVVVPLAALLLGWAKFLRFTPDDRTVMEFQKDRVVAVLAKKVYGDPSPPADAGKMRGLRSTAITIASDQEHLINRFTFIALLNLGIATALWAAAAMLLAQGWRWKPALILVGVSLIFLERRFRFYRRTMFTPFNVAVGVLAKEEKEEKKVQVAAGPRTTPAVYLAGELASNWQDTVINGVSGARYLDPRKHGLTAPEASAEWERAAAAAGDVMFCNVESADPRVALAVQMGHASALGKHVILVDQVSAGHAAAAASLKPLHEVADTSFPTLAEGMKYLQERLKLM